MAFITEVAQINPDIILLCECNHFDEFWSCELRDMGFIGVWDAKFDEAAGIWPVPAYFRGAPSDGCAIFYSKGRFREVWSETFRFSKDSTQLAQEALLESTTAVEKGGFGRLLVGVTHLKAGNYADGANLRREQAAIWAEHLKEKLAFAGANAELVLAGDMNEPREPTDKFQHVGGAVCLLETELGMQDAYVGTPPEVTSWGGIKWWCTIDNILHSRGLLPNALLTIPSAQALSHREPKGLPSKNYPSDHIAIAVSLHKT